ncbi:hypothetical protein [Flavobacterium notoginsengisoli]|uniref:hypothetical protein n=1 Tax=Flavobacterium notoginsengisoli TaxID=1478199 RepID=UPI0036264ABA
MPLIRCSAQKNRSLEEFYTEWAQSDNNISAALGESMLKIIDFINQTFTQTMLFGLTSHAHLLLYPEDDDSSDPYFVIISNSDEYWIEYKMPEKTKPWKNAMIKGATKSFEEFKSFIVIAMSESEGWQESNEVQNLYRQIKK